MIGCAAVLGAPFCVGGIDQGAIDGLDREMPKRWFEVKPDEASVLLQGARLLLFAVSGEVLVGYGVKTHRSGFLRGRLVGR